MPSARKIHRQKSSRTIVSATNVIRFSLFLILIECEMAYTRGEWLENLSHTHAAGFIYWVYAKSVVSVLMLLSFLCTLSRAKKHTEKHWLLTNCFGFLSLSTPSLWVFRFLCMCVQFQWVCVFVRDWVDDNWTAPVQYRSVALDVLCSMAWHGNGVYTHGKKG